MRKGDSVILISKPTGYLSSQADTEVGEECEVLYVDGCCLCVKSPRAEFTANQARFALAN